MKVELHPEALTAIVVHELRYWVRTLATTTSHKDDYKLNKQVIKACRVLLEFYGVDE